MRETGWPHTPRLVLIPCFPLYINQCSESGLNSCSSTSLAPLWAQHVEMWERGINQHFIAPRGTVDQTELRSEKLKAC